VNWHESHDSLMVMHMPDGLEGCEFKPWLVWVDSFYVLILLGGGKNLETLEILWETRKDWGLAKQRKIAKETH